MSKIARNIIKKAVAVKTPVINDTNNCTSKLSLLDLVMNSNNEEEENQEVDNSNLLSKIVHQGIYNDLEDITPMTFNQILTMFTNESCVSIDSTRPLRIEKLYNNFSYRTYNTKEHTDKFGRVTESQKVLSISEYVDYESDDYDEEDHYTDSTFEIYLNDIELIGYDPMIMELMLYLYGGSQVRIYA